MLRLLGEVSAGEAELGSPKQRCLLAALAVDAGRSVPVDRLLDRVWGDAAPRRDTVHSYISRLRQALAGLGLVIERRSSGYVLTGPVDLHLSRELRAQGRFHEALELWRGDPLTGLPGEWAEEERGRLALERLSLQHDLVDTRLRAGEGAQLVAELSSRAAEHPLDERIAGQYLLALHQAGRTAEALDHYAKVRVRLDEELGAVPGAALQELHAELLAATSGPARVVPRQLPAAPTPFVGRQEELARLDAAMGRSDGTVVISAVAGAGGIGKTWLALHWAHQRMDRFPDGQLFVDLLGFTPGNPPLDPAAVVRGFLDGLGVDADRVPADPEAGQALFRRLVADRRMLVVLDNAATADQVVPLLPGGRTCTVIVTSRRVLSSLTAGHLDLAVLSDTEARTLLEHRLGAARLTAEPAAVDELLAWCRGFPLALGLLAGRALTNPGEPLALLAAELREFGLGALDDDDPLASLPAVFATSHRALTEAQQRIFGLLAGAPGPDISLPAAASLAGLSPNETADLLRELQTASLLHQDSHGRYAMHDLIRGYAATTAAPDESAFRRLTSYYLLSARAAAVLVNPNQTQVDLVPSEGVRPVEPAGPAAALDWLDAEYPCLIALLHQAAADGRHEVVLQMAWTLRTFIHRRNHHHDELAVWRAAAEASLHLPDVPNRLIAHRYLGRAHARLGELEQATGILRRVATQAAEHGLAQEAHANADLAWVWERRGDDRQALAHAQHGLEIARAHPREGLIAELLNIVGWHAARLGEYALARSHCEDALRIHRGAGYQLGIATTLDSLGYVDHLTGHHHESISRHQESITILRELGYRAEVVADVHEHLGKPYEALGEWELARAAWTEAETLYRQLDRVADAERMGKLLDSLPPHLG